MLIQLWTIYKHFNLACLWELPLDKKLFDKFFYSSNGGKDDLVYKYDETLNLRQIPSVATSVILQAGDSFPYLVWILTV